MHPQNEDKIEIQNERCISPEKRQQIIDELNLYNNIIMENQKNNKFARQYVKSTV